MSITFTICDVEPRTEWIASSNFESMLSSKQGPYRQNRIYWGTEQRQKQFAVKAKSKSTMRAPSTPSEWEEAMLNPPEPHSFLGAVHRCFQEHRPLSISPDHIWMMIVQGFGIHMQMNAEALRSHFVQHKDKVELLIHRDDFAGMQVYPWPEVFEAFSAQMESHIGKKTSLFVPNFSTTKEVERAAFQIALMDATQSYFDYTLLTLCGIPSITLEGTPEDWLQLRMQTEYLLEFEVNHWIPHLLPILDEFLDASEGQVNEPFWQSLYKYEMHSGGDRVTGWIKTFFPYLEQQTYDKNQQPAGKEYISNNLISWKEEYVGGYGPTTMSSFPSGISTAPFKWILPTQTRSAVFSAGFYGYTQCPDTFSLRPSIDYLVYQSE